jgi:outer membrane protein OmpA-like peptidoglycan-associated protein
MMIFPGVQKPYTALMEPLKMNAKYRISMDIKAMDQSNYFSDILVGFKAEPGPQLDSCLYQVKLVIPDSLCNDQLYHEWITLSTEFTAIGNEKFLLLNSGSLKEYRELIDANPEKFLIEKYQGPPKLKYFIDNITLHELIPPSQTTTMFDSLKTGDRVILNNIYFDFDKFTIRELSYPELEEVFQYLDLHRNIRILISGHTDNFGSDAYNAALSENRARAVVNYLENRGISPDRMQSKGFGATLPIATNNTTAGRQNNRRIELEIVPGSVPTDSTNH